MNDLGRRWFAVPRGGLLGGRGAAVWSVRMARLGALRAVFQRCCGWLRELLGPPPRLRQEPLWGHCLEELAGGLETDGAAPDEPARRAMPRVPPATPRAARSASAASAEGSATRTTPPERHGERRRRSSSPPPRAASRTAAPGGGKTPPARASRELLSRLAGTLPPSRKDRPAAPAKPRPRQRTAPPVSAGTPRPEGHRHRQLGDLAQRAQRSLRQGWPGPSKPPMKAPGATPAAVAAHRPEATLLAGETAPRHLLERWLEGSRAMDRARSSSPASAVSEPPPRPPDPDAARRPAPRSANGAEAPPARPPDAGEEAAPQEAPLALRLDNEPYRATAEPRERPAPPGDGLALPSLLPATAGEFTPAAAAARALRIAGDRRTEPAGSDLSELSAKLQQILAEEARRHGIDV